MALSTIRGLQRIHSTGLALLAALIILGFGASVRAAPPARKPLPWLNTLKIAEVQQQKTGKLILLYFSGTGWDDYTTELDEQVLNTEVFKVWAEKNVIPLRVDFPDPKGAQKQNGWLKQQNDELRLKYSISVVPTFLFLDEAGDMLARVGYDTAKLRKEEAKEHPDSWMAFCDKVIKDKPPTLPLVQQKNLTEAVAYSRLHAIPIAMFIQQGDTEYIKKEKDAIKSHPAFIKFVNRNMVFLDVQWPDDTATAPDAVKLRDFSKQYRFGPAQLEIVVWSPAGAGELKDRITTLSVQNIAPLIKRLDADLPKIDYNGDWIEDYKLAQAICHQEKKDLFISFVQSDDQSWSGKFDEEVYKSPEFRKYAKENLVLLKIDFQKAKPQSASLVEQNRNLADMYAIRGYPRMILLNPLLQKIGECGYMKGGGTAFIRSLEQLRRADHDRRVLPSEEAAQGT